MSPVVRDFSKLAKLVSAPDWRFGPEIRDGIVEAWLKDLQHTECYSFEDFVQVIPPQEPGTYQAEVELIADNLSVTQKAVLEIVVAESSVEAES